MYCRFQTYLKHKRAAEQRRLERIYPAERLYHGGENVWSNANAYAAPVAQFTHLYAASAAPEPDPFNILAENSPVVGMIDRHPEGLGEF